MPNGSTAAASLSSNQPLPPSAWLPGLGTKLNLLMALATGLLVGCAPTLTPHTLYMPTVRNRGEAELRVASGSSGTEAQLGYQATDRLVVHTAVLYKANQNSGKNFRSADVGLGYYRPSATGRWRIGAHVGVATGRGFSGNDNFWLDVHPDEYSQFTVGYTYGYLQPTALFRVREFTLGMGMRIALAQYHRLDETRFDYLGGQQVTFDHAGHNAAFLQPMVQASFRVLPWLGLSASGGFQFHVGPRNRLNDLYPVIAQAGVHFVLSKPAADAR